MRQVRRSWLTKVCSFSHLKDAVAHVRFEWTADNGLRENTLLESVTIRDLTYIAREESQWVPLLLSQIASPALRRVHFVCTSSSFDGVDEASLQTLDEYLAANIEEVDLTFGNTAPQADLEGIVKRGLRRLNERGALHATYPVYTAEVEK